MEPSLRLNESRTPVVGKPEELVVTANKEVDSDTVTLFGFPEKDAINEGGIFDDQACKIIQSDIAIVNMFRI
jgi:hypothetical protein